MASLTSLPPELLLHIFSYLPIPSLSAMRSVCKGTEAVFRGEGEQNEESIYRRSAYIHGLVPLGTGANIVRPENPLYKWYSKQSFAGLENTDLNWKALCKRRVEICRAWSGRLSSDVVRYHPRRDTVSPSPWFLDTPTHVHRIKVDEGNGFFLTTGHGGGLVVTDIESGKTLWNLPGVYCRPFAHLEYENGYIVFDRQDGRKEVWRSESIQTPSQIEEDSEPDPVQHQVFEFMLGTFSSVSPSSFPQHQLSPRFVPHLLIPVPRVVLPPPGGNLPDFTRAYRFVYPHLLAASSTRAYIWDVRTGKRVQTIENINAINLSNLPDRKNVPNGSYTGRDWWNDPPPLVELSDDSDDEDQGSTSSEGNSRVHVEGTSTPPQPSVLSSSLGDSIALPASGQAPLDVEMDSDLESLADRMLRYAQTPMVIVEASKREKKDEVSEESREASFPPVYPFASGFFDEISLFTKAKDSMHGPTNSPQLPNSLGGFDIDNLDPLSLSTDRPGPLGSLRYVELGDRWVFIVGEEGLRVFKRGTPPSPSSQGEGRDDDSDTEPEWLKIAPGELALRLPASRDQYGRWAGKLGVKSIRESPNSELVRQEVVWEYRESEVSLGGNGTSADAVPMNTYGGKERRKVWDKFVAIHISPNQQHLVLLTGSSRIIFIPFFERIIYRQVKLYDVAMEIQLGSPLKRSVYLAYGCKGNPRISAVTQTGVYIVTPYFESSTETAFSVRTTAGLQPRRDVELTVHRVPPFFNDPDRLLLVSCLQMSDTGLWLNWGRGGPVNGDAEDDEDYSSEEEENRMYQGELQTRWADEMQEMEDEEFLSEDEEEDAGVNVPGAYINRRENDAVLFPSHAISSAKKVRMEGKWNDECNASDGTTKLKYGWKAKNLRSPKEQAQAMFEWMFVNGLKDQRKIQVGLNGEGIIVTSDPDRDENTAFEDYSEVHQIKFNCQGT